jgi:hypothetical protein
MNFARRAVFRALPRIQNRSATRLARSAKSTRNARELESARRNALAPRRYAVLAGAQQWCLLFNSEEGNANRARNSQ